MKKTYLSLIALIAALQFSFAQWTTSGSNIYNSNAGNVGIGTTSPSHKLTVYLPSGSGNVISWGNVGGGYYGAIGFDGNGSYFSNFAGNAALYLNGSNGNVGVGTTSPAYKLDVNGAAKATKLILSGTSIASSASQSNISVFSNNGIHISGSLSDGAQDAVTYTSGGGGGAAIGFGRGGSYDTYMVFYTNNGGNMVNGGISEAMRIDQNQNVGVGTTNTQGYKLAVNGAAIATSMKVKMHANWPDFVFKKDYKLPTLTEVKHYIDKNHHLPEIPSADEVHANGLDLGEMNRLLLKKVEELTLYLIEKDEQIQMIKQTQLAEMNKLKNQIAAIVKKKE